ncbi:MAG: hypothetical protein QOE97_1591 [Pseudonocardiales bacterium]|jgi:hypothetical protein|nr:hypothetical protein [Pseudonocardiales bacterium]
MKYMVLMFGTAGEMTEVQSPEWIREMIAFMQGLNQELDDRGELVEARGLTDESRTVRLRDGVPVFSDGPYAEAKESVIGYWVLDVDSEERLLDITGRIVKYSDVVEVRAVAEGPPEV